MLRLTRELASHRLGAVMTIYLNNAATVPSPLAGTDKIQYVQKRRLEAEVTIRKKEYGSSSYDSQPEINMMV